MTLWNRYIFRRGAEVQDMWDQMFRHRRLADKGVRLLYVGGRGFDLRAQVVMDRFIGSITSSGCEVEKAELLLVGFSGYQLSEELKDETAANAQALEAKFAAIGTARTGRSSDFSCGGHGDYDHSTPRCDWDRFEL